MDLLHRPNRTTIIGQSGKGKSTFQERALLCCDGVKFCYDPEGEYQQRFKVRASATPKELAAAIPSGWVIFDPDTMFPGDHQKGFDFFSLWMFNVSCWTRGRKIFACDEMQKWVGTNAAGMPRGLSLILETGRKRGIDAMLVSLQGSIINNRIRSQTTELVCFQCQNSALEWPVSLGLSETELQSLEIGQYISKDTNSGKEIRGHLFK
jgi:hypothetical protein